MACHIDMRICKLTLLSTTPVILSLVQENAEASPAVDKGIFMMMSFTARSAVVVIVGYLGDLFGLRTANFISVAAGIAGIPFIFLFSDKKTV